MSPLPGFLRAAGGGAIQSGDGPIRAGSFALASRGAPWRYSLLHDRPQALLLWITRGQGRAIVNGIRRGLSAHNALFLPAGTLFSVDLPTGVQALYVESPAAATGRLPAEPLLLRVRDAYAQAELTNEIDAMQKEARAGRPRLAEALDARLRLVAVWLHRQALEGATDHPPDTAANRLVRRFAAAASRDYALARPVADHAEALDVTATHLSRVCRHACGKTAADILAERRLHAARCALEAPTPPVGRIALDLGFSSPAHFSRFVQTRTGQSPTALRAAARRG